MTKNLKLKIKNTQLAKAAGLEKVKAKLSKDKLVKPEEEKELASPAEEQPRRIRAKTKSSFATKEQLVEPQSFAAVEEEKPTPAEELVEKPVAVKANLVEESVEVSPQKLGPTGKHVKDLLPKAEKQEKAIPLASPAVKEKPAPTEESKDDAGALKKGKKVKTFKDLKPAKQKQFRSFDARDRAGLSESEDEKWRKKRKVSQRTDFEEQTIRPTSLVIRLPIMIKDLAAEMKLKSSQLIQKLFLQNMTYTLNDFLDDETTVQFLGSEFGCEIKVDTSEEERVQVTSETIAEEIAHTDPSLLILRPPVVAFMGHVDHGKTSLIDAIRKSNVASGEAGAITQHIGAFKCKTAAGELTILDTPGHEAFSAMRARGAEVTDIVVLVIAGDEGLKEQTKEAISHAKASNVTIVVAINKCDKPNFNAENVYRELAEVDLLPEKWGGQTITVNTSAVTKEGLKELLEMLALQAEVLELKANPSGRARGTVLESEMHKGLGAVATILVQNGTLHQGDALVFEKHYARVKTLYDEHGKSLSSAGPGTPVEITGLSGLPAAGDPFIVVKSEKEAKHITETREEDRRQLALMQRKIPTLESFMEKGPKEKKILNIILRGDVQGSVEALKTSIEKIDSDKAQANVIFMGVGEISESDVQLAAASQALILGFHTRIESHAEPLLKEYGVKVRLHNIIYHAVDDVKDILTGLLDKLEEEQPTGEAEVKATFKSSQLGIIAGCKVNTGTIARSNHIRVIRNGKEVWKGTIASLKREKEDVKEVKKGFECGILIQGFSNIEVGDLLSAFEIVYKSQEL